MSGRLRILAGVACSVFLVFVGASLIAALLSVVAPPPVPLDPAAPVSSQLIPTPAFAFELYGWLLRAFGESPARDIVLGLGLAAFVVAFIVFRQSFRRSRTAR